MTDKETINKLRKAAKEIRKDVIQMTYNVDGMRWRNDYQRRFVENGDVE